MAAIRGEENKSCAVSAFLLLITLFLLSANGQKAQSARSADDYFNQGLFQYHRGNLNGASADFSRAIAINPQLALAYYYRGTIRAIRGNWDAAIADYSKEVSARIRIANIVPGVTVSGLTAAAAIGGNSFAHLSTPLINREVTENGQSLRIAGSRKIATIF